ncbi:glycosyltransferase family 4 protein [Dehalobacter sp. DCM]|uniref:glycosyltransferase family 4 protein n=1 Tax=Dehalobacter sp. DCM TaxID=2907827 RepID=UPI0030815040|nr:glycosyltransferase family 4 protein [Dehalobacter sp. DCM]
MKICILTTGHPALDNRIFYKQALSLKKQYDEITLIAPDQQSRYNHEGIEIIGVPRSSSLMGRFQLGDTVVAKAIEVKADVYHFHDFELIYKVLKIKKAIPNCKLVYDVHEHYPDMMRMSRKVPTVLRPLAAFIVDRTEAHYARKFDHIITADDAVMARMKTFNPRTDVIYNFTEFQPVAQPEEDVSPPKEYDVIYQGGITLERGVYHVVQAIKILKEKYPDIRMIFVGPFNDSRGQKIVNDYIEENQLQENILFTGRVPHIEVENYMRKSKVGVVTLLPLPKYFKNIPIKQFEYMSCGIPIVGSNLPTIKPFVESYHSGIIVDPTKPEEIAKAITILLSDPRLSKEMGDNGMKAVRKEYNWGRMEEKLLKIYQQLEKTNG